MTTIEQSLRDLLDAIGTEAGADVARKALASLSPLECAHGLYHFPNWGREKQILPADTDWASFTFIAGRRFGKNLALSSFLNAEVQAGRAKYIGLSAQNEAKAIDTMVEGETGIIETSPPWCKAERHDLEVTWPNGARAYIRTPESPAGIRGLTLDHAWLSELQSWPDGPGSEALMNFRAAVSRAPNRILGDATGRTRSAILKDILEQAARDPRRHRVIRGALSENTSLSQDYIRDFVAKYPPGTRRYREEFLGEIPSESESALVKADWIDRNRRHAPASFVLRTIGIDPAPAGKGKGRDRTGIVEAGQGADGRIYVISDHTKHFDSAVEWANLVLSLYSQNRVNLVTVESNAGGELSYALIHLAAQQRNLIVEKVDKPPTYPRPGVVYVKEVYVRGSKELRAEPLSAAYEAGRVSHVIGANLSALEDVLCSWEPGTAGQASPDSLDALVHATVEMLGLDATPPAVAPGDARAWIQMADQLLGSNSPKVNVASYHHSTNRGRL